MMDGELLFAALLIVVMLLWYDYKTQMRYDTKIRAYSQLGRGVLEMTQQIAQTVVLEEHLRNITTAINNINPPTRS